MTNEMTPEEKVAYDEALIKFDADMNRMCMKFGIDYNRLLENHFEAHRFASINWTKKQNLVTLAITNSIMDKFEGESFYLIKDVLMRMTTRVEDALHKARTEVEYSRVFSREYPNLFTKEMYEAKHGVKDE